MQELGDAGVLFRNVQGVLTLLGDGLPGSADLVASDTATLAHCVGTVDSDRLASDITEAAARVHGWYDRLIENPARRAAKELGEGAG